MNEHERDRIAAALHQARPDWPTRQLRTLLDSPQMVDRPRRDVFVALAWVASEPNSASPYRVLEAGPWWRAAALVGGNSQPRNTGPWCDICGTSQHLHRAGDHEFTTRRHEKRDPDVIHQIVQATRALTTPRTTAGTTTPDTGTEKGEA